MTKEEAAASYSMNDDNDYICSDDDHNIRDNNTKPKHESQAWGTWEELLLACAVKRHGFCDWDSVASEVRTRTSTSSPVFISPDSCRLKYRDLNRRFKEPAAAEEEEGGNDIPWLEELRSLRVAELRREVQEYDVSILSLQLKVKRLEEERDGGEKLDLEEEERKEERSENDGGEKAVSTAEESDRENRSMNESNSTGAGEKTVGGGDEPSRTRGDDLDPDPVNTAEEGSEASQSGELGESGTSGRKWKRKRREDGDGEIRSAASKSQPLIRLLDLIRSHPRGSLFERRVRSQETEEYKSLVKQHLDIETIQRKLKQGSYDSSSLTFYRDLQLLFTNAVTFFPSSSSESIAARELRAIVSEEMRKESGKSSPRLLKASGAIMTSSIKADAAETSEQKSSAPLVVCKRRRFASAKAKASSPSSSSFSQKEETKEETVSDENENVETGGGRGSKRTANNTKTGKGKNKEKQTEAKTEKKVVASSDKKKSVADFLKRIKKGSPQKEDKDQNKSKKESKPKPRELRSNNVGKGRKKAEVENTTTPAKRAPGRPPQKKTVEATATASGKRGRESGSTGKDNKQPKKRSRR